MTAKVHSGAHHDTFKGFKNFLKRRESRHCQKHRGDDMNTQTKWYEAKWFISIVVPFIATILGGGFVLAAGIYGASSTVHYARIDSDTHDLATIKADVKQLPDIQNRLDAIEKNTAASAQSASDAGAILKSNSEKIEKIVQEIDPNQRAINHHVSRSTVLVHAARQPRFVARRADVRW